jgi:hypothetical protein
MRQLSRPGLLVLVLVLCGFLLGGPGWAQGSPQDVRVSGVVTDDTGARVPGVLVQLLGPAGQTVTSSVTDETGTYGLAVAGACRCELVTSILNFATARRPVDVPESGSMRIDTVIHLALSAEVTVSGRRTFRNLAEVEHPEHSLVGVARSASEGAVTAPQIESRPVMRPGDVLESVPGLIVTQHSGEGKANQFFLRGFNLDHGTDFATTVAGVPVNLPTHAHGHGYTDVNFVIPELVGRVRFRKGPYFAEDGDFSAAGSAHLDYVTELDEMIARVSGGQDGWARALFAATPKAGRGRALVAVEVAHNDGPWVRGDDLRKVNGVIRYSEGDARRSLAITGMGYDARWSATDQLPRRGVDSGLIPRFGEVDPTDGGHTYRYGGSGDFQWTDPSTVTRLTAFGIGSSLNLFSNFTYFLDDPEDGDQFEQAERRLVGGARLSHRRLTRLGRAPLDLTVGGELRYDRISPLGLYGTVGRVRRSVTREDRVRQTSGAVYVSASSDWTSSFSTTVGLRGDLYRFDVSSSLPGNSGRELDGLLSPKAGVEYSPWRGTAFYVNGGFGFHSNDARGATMTIDPTTGERTERVTPLVRARGAEVGIRTVAIPRMQMTASWWRLGLDSELVFIGDAGNTEAGRPSLRHGIEVSAFATPWAGVTIDGDLAFSSARFTDDDPAGSFVPGAIASMASLGVAFNGNRTSAGVRLRYFGPRPLVEDGAVKSAASTLVGARVAYSLTRRLALELDASNLFDRKVSDIDYFYTSRLPGEAPGGVDDIHTHPALPRTLRINLLARF